MLQKAPEFGCVIDDVACLCNSPRFVSGLLTCVDEGCPVVSSICSSANAATNTASVTTVAVGIFAPYDRLEFSIDI